MIQVKKFMVILMHDPTMLNRVIRWVELLLVVMLAVALARLVADLVFPAIPGTPEMIQDTPSSPPISAESASNSQVVNLTPALINLFGEPESALAPVATEQPLQATSLNLVLKGILADQHTDNRLALIAVGGQKEKVYRVGERIEGADIVRIEARRVVIRRNGVTEALDLEVYKLSTTPVQQNTFNRINTAGDIRRVSDTERVISRDSLKQQLTNLPALLQQASAVPHIDDGEQVGFRIASIQQGSVFEQLGFRKDDVIYAVNGTPVRNVGDAMNVYRNLASASAFRVGVLRGGQDLKLDLSVQ